MEVRSINLGFATTERYSDIQLIANEPQLQYQH